MRESGFRFCAGFATGFLSAVLAAGLRAARARPIRVSMALPRMVRCRNYSVAIPSSSPPQPQLLLHQGLDANGWHYSGRHDERQDLGTVGLRRYHLAGLQRGGQAARVGDVLCGKEKLAFVHAGGLVVGASIDARSLRVCRCKVRPRKLVAPGAYPCRD